MSLPVVIRLISQADLPEVHRTELIDVRLDFSHFHRLISLLVSQTINRNAERNLVSWDVFSMAMLSLDVDLPKRVKIEHWKVDDDDHSSMNGRSVLIMNTRVFGN